MKLFGKIMGVITALAAIAGIVYVVATYGDKIVEWARELIERAKDFFGCNCDCDCQCEECQCEEFEECECVDADFQG